MKLYNVPRDSPIKLNDDIVLKFHHLDGMYSFCTDESGKVYHIAAWEDVEVVKDKE
jgi:hypothetical protein